jgi:signal transduction histidine kinase
MGLLNFKKVLQNTLEIKMSKIIFKSHLSSKYRSNVFIAAIVVFVIAAMILVYQYFTQRQQEINHIRETLIGRAFEIDAIVEATTDRVLELQLFTKNHLVKEKSLPKSPLLSYIHDSTDSSFFFTEVPNWNYERSGNVYGQGSFKARSPSFYSEVNAVSHLLPLLKVAKETTSHLAWLYFFSEKRLAALIPGIKADDYIKDLGISFDTVYDEIYNTEWWIKSLPENNPNAYPLWTKPYFDVTGQGWMVTYAIPVTIDKQFRGVAAGDITLDFINKSLRKSDYSKGTFLVVSDSLQILGNSTGKDFQIDSSLLELLGKNNFKSEPAHGFHHLRSSGYNLFTTRLSEAPWYMIYVIQETDLMQAIMPSFAIHFVVIVGFFVILIIGYRLLERTYVKPAIALVEHIEKQSHDQSSTSTKVPSMWQNWFLRVSEAFDAKRELHKLMQEDAEKLNQLVEERTQELSETNELLQEEILEHKQAENEKKALEAQLNQAQKMEAMGLMAGGIAHDLNNILSGIVSYPELLLMDIPVDSPMRKPMETIKESGLRAADVVADLMTIARGVATSKEVLNFNTVVEEYLNSIEHRNLDSIRPSVTFKTQFDPDLLNANGSPTHIKKTLMNLVINASEAIEGSGTVTISTMNQYLDEPLRGYEDVVTGEYVMLTISDDGLGISQQDLERIFEPFYTKKVMDRSGTGLGLAVVWNTVQDHKGYINVKSSEKGTVFELYFPTTRKQVATEKEEVPLEDYLGHGEKILVVDDEERQREIASGILTKLGYNAEVVSSGEEAIEYVKENHVDLIVLDMVMPKGINGRKTYEEIIKIRPGQKAIIASGYAKTKEVDLAQELGAGKYIKKPYTLAKVGLAVKEELEK